MIGALTDEERREWRRPGLEWAGAGDQLTPDLTWGVRNPQQGLADLQEALLDPIPCLCDWPCDCWEKWG